MSSPSSRAETRAADGATKGGPLPSKADAPAKIPAHIAIIMDGNGRWARQRGLPRIEGHRQGVETARRIADISRELGIRCLTLYAFSVENWQRPAAEVGALMHLLEFFLRREIKSLVKNRVHLRTIGRTQELPGPVQTQLQRALDATTHFTDYTLVLALNYGSRTEMVDAARAYAAAIAAGHEKLNDASWATFSRYLYTAGLPDPDLVIRTSGETRVSNFLLLQSAYAEFIFTPVLWPDFTRDHLVEAIASFAQRERRFGLTSEQVKPPRGVE
ncbi:MAG: isoprenyl transferase [Opitutaceae bacterium]|jgi:undecaprenyl diphosphate synthase